MARPVGVKNGTGKGDKPGDTLRWAIFFRDRFACLYCGRDLGNEADPFERHIDHVIPRAMGGTNDHGNMVLACSLCNRKKGDWYAIDEFVTTCFPERAATIYAELARRIRTPMPYWQGKELLARYREAKAVGKMMAPAEIVAEWRQDNLAA